MTSEEMIAVFDRHEAAENARDAQAASETYVEDGYYVNIPLGARFEGRQGVTLSYLGIFTAFPDFHSERTLLVAGEDFLYEEGRTTATFDGPFMHLEPTGRRVDFPFTSYVSFRDGLMLGEHVSYDSALLAEQAGISLEDLAGLRAALGD